MICTIHKCGDPQSLRVCDIDESGQKKLVEVGQQPVVDVSRFAESFTAKSMCPLGQVDRPALVVEHISSIDIMPKLYIRDLGDRQIAIRVGDCEVHVLLDSDTL